MARGARAAGVKRIVACAFENETSEDLAGLVDQIEWMRVGQLGRMLRFLKASGARQAVMSGQSARIDVGDEIPVVSSSARSIDNSDAPIVNNVEYRKTGVTLEIRPTVHASGYVDVEVAQELSQATQTTTSDIDSPTIFNRSIETTVSLKDGGSVLLGGLVSSSGGTKQRGIPVLGKLPGIGKLFRVDGDTEDRTELMVLVIPYVVRTPEEAEDLATRLAQPE
jgi:general secretion pathway protein D